MNSVARGSYFFHKVMKVSISSCLTGMLNASAYPMKVSTTIAMNRFKKIYDTTT